MPHPASVLFACNLNRVRSPMAAALLRRRFPGLRVESVGLDAGEDVDPFAVAVLEEVGVALAGHRPRDLTALGDAHFDLVVTLTPEAGASPLLSRCAARHDAWSAPDPTLVEGAREQRLDAYREVRDRLDRLISERFGVGEGGR